MGWPRETTGWHDVNVSEVTLKPKEDPTSAWITVDMKNGDGVKTRASWNLYTEEAIAWGKVNPSPRTGNPRDYARTNHIGLGQMRDFFRACGVESDDLPTIHEGEDVTLDESQALAAALEQFTSATGDGVGLCAYIAKDSRGYNESTRFRKATG